MVLIISNNIDFSTNDVIDWLCYKGSKFIRINDSNHFELDFFRIENGKVDFKLISLDGKIEIQYSKLSSYWYRRGKLMLTPKVELDQFNEFHFDVSFLRSIDSYLMEDKWVTEDLIDNLIQDLHGFGKFKENFTNKLINLVKASHSGFNISDSLLTKNRNLLIQFYNSSSDQVITKSITQSGEILWKNLAYSSLTRLVSQNQLRNFCGYWNSFIQKRIRKQFELRIFYLEGKIFSSAIFSQSNLKTLLDFRNYDDSKPNRVIPFILPKMIESKVINFMKSISMKSGSLDIVVDTQNRYYFLEVNPIGQFSQVSIPCNYYIEKYIAEFLIYEKEDIF